MYPSADRAARTAELMSRFLGSDVMAGIADGEVTDIAVDPTDGVVRSGNCSGAHLLTGEGPASFRLLPFLNAAATHVGATLMPDQPPLRAALPPMPFRGARLQDFVPPVALGLRFCDPPAGIRGVRVDEHTVRPTSARSSGRTSAAPSFSVGTLVVGATGTGKCG